MFIIEQNTTSLIGTQDECSALLNEQDQAYFESPRQDQEKDKERELLAEKELNHVEWQESLRNIRESHFLPEPDISKEHVFVSVKRITQGVNRAVTTYTTEQSRILKIK